MNETVYVRRDVNSILDYLKEKARELSDGRWTDFSAGDIGSVMLGLMAYLADVNNFQIDKTASELYLDTALERSSIMSLIKLVGYKPRHYQSAYALIQLIQEDYDPETADTGTTIVPAYTTISNERDTITYTLLEPCQITQGVGYCVAYEGERSVQTYTYDQITKEGRIYLPDYKLGTNTVQVLIPGVSNNFITQVEDVRFIAGEFAYSVHVDEYAHVYIQLPSYWTDLLAESSTVTISYLLTQGENGRVGSNILTEPGRTAANLHNFTISNPAPSVGGYFPETADELKANVPRQARTMITVVTKKDLEDLVMNLPEIACIKAGDYNDEWTGYIQPDDAYKCKVLAVPSDVTETSLYDDKGQPTQTLISLVKYLDERRLASIMMYYEDPKRLVPNIELNIYTNEADLRTADIAENAKQFMKTIYSRENLPIGQSLYGSVIGKDLLNAFPEITYLEVQAPEFNIEVDFDEYIDMAYAKFKIYVNDNLIEDEWKTEDKEDTPSGGGETK